MGNPSDIPRARVTTPKNYIDECLAAHNKLRAKHGCPKMTIKEDLCQIAQAWANHSASVGKMAHQHPEGYGENLYFSTNDPPAAVAVEKWYSEIKDFDWVNCDSDPPQSGIGHFTQVVWKESVELGVAKSTGAKGTYVVAIYSPPGNGIGDFSGNVPRAK